MIAIDPGAGGGIAWRDRDSVVQAVPMPEGIAAQVDMLRHVVARAEVAEVIRENVGGYVPGNAGPGAVKFGGHCMGLDYALYALGIPQRKAVAPQTWQKFGGWSVSKHLPPGYKAMPEGTKEERLAKKRVRDAAVRTHKAEIKDTMQRRFPHLRVTLGTADALALLVWGEAHAGAGNAGAPNTMNGNGEG